MASMTAAACACLVSSTTTAPAAHCDRASSAHLASSSSSFSTLLAAAPLKNRTSVSPLLKRLGHGRGFGSARIASSGEDASWAIRAFPGGDDNRDDAGVIKDMGLYLDDLSLEYDSVWDTKPAWCQPWTIVGTGVAVISASWLPLHNAFVTGGVALVMGLWWYSFLYVYPQGYSEMIAERRRRMENGSEDTYGVKRVDESILGG